MPSQRCGTSDAAPSADGIRRSCVAADWKGKDDAMTSDTHAEQVVAAPVDEVVP